MPLLPPQGLGEFRFSETSVVLSAVPKQIAANSANRVLLVIGAASGNSNVSTNPAVTTSTGVQVNPTVQTLEMYWSLHASMVSQAWYGVSAAAGTVTVFEVFYQPNPRDTGVISGDSSKTSNAGSGSHGENVSSIGSKYGRQA